MKEPDKQIFSMLQAFNQSDVLKAIELYQSGIDNKNETAKQELIEAGWLPQDEKPENREFYFFNDQYWVQTETARKANIAAQKAAMAKKKAAKKYTGQKMDLSLTDLVCPKCQSKMYKQSVCAGCKAGKAGFKIRLVCEDDADHEILL